MHEVVQVLAASVALLWVWRSVIWIAVSCLLVIGALALIRPATVSNYFDRFVAAKKIDLVELALRLIVSLAFVAVSPEARYPQMFFWFGAMLAITAIPMMFVHRFQRRHAARAVPFARRILPIMGVLAIALGGFIAWALV